VRYARSLKGRKEAELLVVRLTILVQTSVGLFIRAAKASIEDRNWVAGMNGILRARSERARADEVRREIVRLLARAFSSPAQEDNSSRSSIGRPS